MSKLTCNQTHKSLKKKTRSVMNKSYLTVELSDGIGETQSSYTYNKAREQAVYARRLAKCVCDTLGISQTVYESTPALPAIMVWVEIFQIYGFDITEENLGSCSRSVIKTYEDSQRFGGEWFKYFKYKNAAFFSLALGQPLPPGNSLLLFQNAGVLLGGLFYKWTRRLNQSEREEFALTILMSKKGMPLPTEEMAREAAIKAALVMTTPKEFIPYCFNSGWGDIELDKDFLVAYIREETKSLFKGVKFNLDEYVQPYVPSRAAMFGYPRSMDGQMRQVLDLCVPKTPTGAVIWPVMKHRLEEGEYTKRVSESFFPETTEVAGEEVLVHEQDLFDLDDGECYTHLTPAIETGEQVKAFRNMFWRAFKLAMEEKPRCSTVGLPEPLKIRTITRGPGLTYFVLKPLQKLLWKTLKEKKGFGLIGEPISAEYLNERFSRLGKNYSYLSGDYTAATDELHSWVSETIAEAISEEISLPPQFTELFLRSLTGHEYQMEDGTFLPQARGQLMGSITSFVVLCIANHCLLKLSSQLCGENEPLIDINGDDCLVAYTHPDFPEVWRGVGSSLGLTESLGKTYFSSTFCTLNSRFFRMVNGRWTQFDYVNLGLSRCNPISLNVGESYTFSRGRNLATDQGKRGKGYYKSIWTERDQEDEDAKFLLTDFKPKYNDLKQLSPKELWPLMKARMFYLYGHSLKRAKIPWFNPEYLCGLGLSSDAPPDYLTLCRFTDLKKKYNGGVSIPTQKTQKHYRLWDRMLERLRANCRLLSERPYSTLANPLPLNIPLVYEWVKEGGALPKITDRSDRYCEGKWMRRVSRLWSRTSHQGNVPDRWWQKQRKEFVLGIKIST